MSDKLPAELDRMLDDLPVGRAPVGSLVAAGRAVKRRHRRVVVAATATAAVLVGGAVATGSLDRTGRAPVQAGGREEGLTAVDLPTSPWTPGDDAATAQISGVLSLDPNGCVVLNGPGYGARTYVAWPAGYSAVRDRDGRVRLRDERGADLARHGDQLSTGGAYLTHPADPHPCLPQDAEVAVVQSEVTVTPRPVDPSTPAPPDGGDDEPGGGVAGVLDALDLTLSLQAPRRGGQIPSVLRVQNPSGTTVTDPGCRSTSNYAYGILPLDSADADLRGRVMTKCVGPQDLPPGYDASMAGPVFEVGDLDPGRYLAAIDFGDARSDRLTVTLRIPAGLTRSDGPYLPCPPGERTGVDYDIPGPGRPTPEKAVTPYLDGLSIGLIEGDGRRATVTAVDHEGGITRVYSLTRHGDGWWPDGYISCQAG